MKILGRTVLIVMGLVLAGLAFVYFSPGYNLYLVRSESMRPAINMGDLIITGPLDGPVNGEVKPGTIITYEYSDDLVTHRVHSIDGTTLVTKGDATEDPDPWSVTMSNIRGVYLFKIPYVGYMLNFIHTKLGWFGMKVLIIEDDSEIVEVISLAFEIRWPGVKLVSSHLGEKGVELVESENPDVVILDLGLPDTSGFDVLKEIRAFSDVPVLILTVRGEEADVVKGLEWGADDYMVKPFRQLELLSRIRALMRRASPAGEETPLVCGELRFDPSTKQLSFGEKEIDLTHTEGSILHQLMINAGKVVTYSSLAEAVWGDDYPDATDSLRVYIRRLREKIETEPSQPKIILTKTGIGYLLAKPD